MQRGLVRIGARGLAAGIERCLDLIDERDVTQEATSAELAWSVATNYIYRRVRERGSLRFTEINGILLDLGFSTMFQIHGFFGGWLCPTVVFREHM